MCIWLFTDKGLQIFNVEQHSKHEQMQLPLIEMLVAVPDDLKLDRNRKQML